MSLNDSLASALSVIMNAEKVSKDECKIKPISKVIKEVLRIMAENGYIGEFKEVEDGKGNYIVINLLGRVNKCNAIKPRHPVTLEDFEKFEKRYLLAKDFGIIIISTSEGMMTHIEAKKKNLGGRLVSYCY